MKIKPQTWLVAISIVLLFSGGLLRLFQFLENRNLWHDEAALALNIIDRGPLDLLKPLDDDQAAPIFFLLLVNTATFIFGTGEQAFRLVPFITSLISLPLFYYLSRSYLNRWCGPVSVFLFSLHVWLIYFSQELKQYSMDVTVALGLALFSLRLINLNQFRKVDILLLGLLGFVSIFLSHPSIFALAGISGTLILLKTFDKLDISTRHIAMVVSCWVLAFGFNYFIFLRSSAGNTFLNDYWVNGFLPFPTSPETAKVWLKTCSDFLKYAGFSGLWKYLATTSAAVAFVITIRKLSPGTLMFSLFFVFTMGASFLGKYPFSERLVLFLVPFFMLLAVRGIQELSNHKPLFVFGILAAGLMAPTLKTIGPDLLHPRDRGDIKELISYIEKHREPGDHVFVYQLASFGAKYYNLDSLIKDGNLFYCPWIPLEESRMYEELVEKTNKWPRTWFLFALVVGNQEELILSHVDGELLDEQHAHRTSLYLYSGSSDDS